MSAVDKHYLLNRDNLTHQIQMQLSQKQKTFPQFFFAFLKSILNFKNLPKKDDPHSCCICGNNSSEKHGLINVWKAVFQRTLRQTTWQMGGNSLAIWTTAPLLYLLITVKEITLEEDSFRYIEIRKTVC